MPIERGARAEHERVAEKAVFAGDEQLARMAPHHGGDPLKGHHRVERRHLDADDAGKIENRVKRRVVVGHAAGGLVEIEGDRRQLAAQPRMVGDGIVALGKDEQGVGPAAAGLDGRW